MDYNKTITKNIIKKTIFITGLLTTLFTMTAQVGIGTTSPDNSAALEVQSTTKGFLPPRVTYSQMNAITDPAEGLMIYCTDCATKGLYVFNASIWQSIFYPDRVITLIVEVTSNNGKIWMDRNLGASRAATSFGLATDSEAYGDLYQWGRNSDGHQSRTSTTAAGPVASGNEGSNFISNSSSPYDWLSSQDDTRWNGATKGAHDPCPSGYRLPTEAEWEAERSDWTSNNAVGAFASPLRLPVAGYRDRSNGTLDNVGSNGSYWSGTISGTTASSLVFVSSNANMYSNGRANGFSVRCIKDV